MSSSSAAAGSDWRALDLFEFARTARRAEGSLPLGDLPRMVNEVAEAGQFNAAPTEAGIAGRAGDSADRAAETGMTDDFVRWSARGEAREVIGGGTELYLHLAIEAAPWLECQRCLTPYRQPLDVAATFQIVASEEEADAAPLDDDEVDVIVGSRQFDLYELIEEELLLSLPLVPKHAVCPSVHEALVTGQAGDIVIERSAEDEPPRRDEADNPFAALQALKRDVPPKDGA
ncbi:MAG: YceD family protein [Pararobbsia sp.]